MKGNSLGAVLAPGVRLSRNEAEASVASRSAYVEHEWSIDRDADPRSGPDRCDVHYRQTNSVGAEGGLVTGQVTFLWDLRGESGRQSLPAGAAQAVRDFRNEPRSAPCWAPRRE
jgi:hypothetical protein